MTSKHAIFNLLLLLILFTLPIKHKWQFGYGIWNLVQDIIEKYFLQNIEYKLLPIQLSLIFLLKYIECSNWSKHILVCFENSWIHFKYMFVFIKVLFLAHTNKKVLFITPWHVTIGHSNNRRLCEYMSTMTVLTNCDLGSN